MDTQEQQAAEDIGDLGGKGKIDESQKKFRPEEKAIANRAVRRRSRRHSTERIECPQHAWCAARSIHVRPVHETVGEDGTTIGYTKTTVTPDGSIAHIKDKLVP